MPQKSSTKRTSRPRVPRQREGRIHVVITYPFLHPANLDDLEHLYGMIARLNDDRATYARPITVIDRKTMDAMSRSKRHVAFREKTVAACSDIMSAWCVDTGQMWYTGLGEAFDRGKSGDTYWVIPGDIDYSSRMGRDLLTHLHDLPEICDELDQDVCIGEIHTDHNSSKQLIDDYGTFALLYNWFPEEAKAIREFTERPRSEFVAIRHEFLSKMLHRRWYAYEQTVVILLHAIFERRKVSRYFVGEVTDLRGEKETLDNAMQKIERTERVLKTLWRERNQTKKDWVKEYRRLEEQSGLLRKTAFTILGNLL
jgi:hypothetical protein